MQKITIVLAFIFFAREMWGNLPPHVDKKREAVKAFHEANKNIHHVNALLRLSGKRIDKMEKEKQAGKAFGHKVANFFGYGKPDVMKTNPKLKTCHRTLQELAQCIHEIMPIRVFTCHRTNAE